MSARGSLIVCDYVWPKSVEAKTSLMGVISQLNTPTLPALVLGPHVYWTGVFLDAEPDSTHELRLDIIAPSGERRDILGSKLTMRRPQEMINFQHPLPPIQVTEQGWHEIQMLLDGEVVGTAQLKVEVQT
jgi:hypothetical protein